MTIKCTAHVHCVQTRAVLVQGRRFILLLNQAKDGAISLPEFVQPCCYTGSWQLGNNHNLFGRLC